MKDIIKFGSKKNLSTDILLNLLSGLVISLLATLLIYFKQKDVLHHTILLVTVAGLYVISYTLRDWIAKLPQGAKIVCIILLLLLSGLAPQFIYQIRPHTFYISGFILGTVLILATSVTFLSAGLSARFKGSYLLFILGYILGQFLSVDLLQYLLFGLSIVVMLFFIAVLQLKKMQAIMLSFTALFTVGFYSMFSTPVLYFTEQANYEDKILFTAETQYHQLTITQWHDHQWYFIDGLKNISSIDEYLYYEPMVHGGFKVANDPEKVLVIGGENGCLVREVLKYTTVQHIEVLSYDTLLRNLGIKNHYFTSMNDDAFKDGKVTVIHQDILEYLSAPVKKYDVIFIDLPDPKSIETNQYYTIEFYKMLHKLLADGGMMITQAGSPYYATQAFYIIGKTIEEAGFSALPIHNQILTLGEWGWYICSKSFTTEKIKSRLIAEKPLNVETKWFNQEAALLIASFGKTYTDTLNLSVNSIDNPLAFRHYVQGNWDLK